MVSNKTSQLCLDAMLAVILFVAQIALASIANFELVSCLIIVYSRIFKKHAYLIVFTFIILEGLSFGFGLWWFSYWYVWFLLVALTIFLDRKTRDRLYWAMVGLFYGLLFGALFALAYLFVDPVYAFTYWLAGLPWDIWHGICNFFLIYVSQETIFNILKKACLYV